ncbi:MAG: hypothetical protein F4013_07645 [Gammaproteobacteria bacterium]|nr:hypothetical protein [Gammaproteobacteria bacterium]
MSATRELMFDHGQPSYSEVNTDVINALTTTTWRYWVTLGISAATALLFFVAPWIYQIIVGVGAAGMNRNAMWGTYLSNFIFWIGLSHSGTLLSAVLHITQSDWRKSIYRSAEAMTLFSLMTAAMFVMVHVGRVWFVHWTFPIPNPMELWPNFRSPLMFDVMAILTYLTASSVFIYMGSLPDFAAVRDRSTGLRRKVYAVMCFGWRGTAHEWHTLGWAYTFFAVLVIPLAVSVHSIVSWDFAMSTVPGLHHTIFAPYFVCGAIYSGTAGIVTVMWMLRKFMGFGRYIGQLHIDNLSKLLLVLSLIWTYINFCENFSGWYSGTSFEYEAILYRIWEGPFWWLYWEMILFCAVVPLVLFSRRIRTNWNLMLVISILINIGMLTERFVIVASSLPRKFLPDVFGTYFPSLVEISITVGSFAIFTTLFLLFVKIFPAVSIYEVKETLNPLRKREAHT